MHDVRCDAVRSLLQDNPEQMQTCTDGKQHRHSRNLAEAARLAMSRGTPGSPYFVTDGEHPYMEDFQTRLMETQVGCPAVLMLTPSRLRAA